MNDKITLTYHVSPEDFTRAGEASSNVKSKLKKLGVHPEAVRKVAIALYEGEINMVIHANGGDITVDITPDKIVMVLKDQGPGIADIEKTRVFEMFFTGNNKIGDSRRSLGLGLALCKSIIEAHGGKITLTDNLPHGAKFTFSLPASEVNMNE